MKKNIKAISFILASLIMIFSLVGCSNNVSTSTESKISETVLTTNQTEKTETEKTETETTLAPITNATSNTETTKEEPIIVDPNLRKYVLSEEELYDKIQAGWLGEMIGVSWAAKTEFHFVHRMMQDNEMYSTYAWNPNLINEAYVQDDLYVEIPFLKAMYNYGYNCDMYYIGRDYRYSTFTVWHANDAGRNNLISGAIWPDSGNYAYNTHADDIDWQIDADYLGMMYPGLVNESANKSFDVGHFVNYGDGVYGGVFVSAMHSAAFTANSIDEIVKAGMQVIPDGTPFKDVISAVYNYYKDGKTRTETWQMLEDNWAYDDRCSKYNNQSANIDAKLNAAYVLIGLLYGEGDFEKSIVIATSCGEDSDCNPSTVASILGNYYGTKCINSKFTQNVDYDKKFSFTDVTLREAIDMDFALAKDVLNNSPYVTNNGNGTWTIAVNDVYKSVTKELWPEGFYVNVKTIPVGNNRYTFSYMSENGTIKDVKIETGDGYVATDYLASYRYKELGTYTFRCEFTSTDGEKFTLEKPIYVLSTNSIVTGYAISSCEKPTGSGNKNVKTILDGYIPVTGKAGNAQSYDTNDGLEHDSAYVGMIFDYRSTLDSVVFIEGKHYTKGGWFEEEPYIEVLVDNEWIKVESKLDRKYPENDRKSQGDDFEVFIFNLNEQIKCDGFRVTGKPGGQGRFISCGELVPCVVQVDYPNGYFDDKDDIIISNVSYPQGSGNKDISIICDNKANVNDSNSQYDTFVKSENRVDEVYIGYLFKENKTISEVEYTSGMMFDGGGWFKDGTIKVQIFDGKSWLDVNQKVTPSYPNSNLKTDFETGKTYVFSFDSVSCLGLRIIGRQGGNEGFISISELSYK